jgi:dihydroorotase
MSNVLFLKVGVLDFDSPWSGKLADVLVENGVIKKITAAGELAASNLDSSCKVTQGGFLSPGWVDLRCQLSDPGYEQREELDSLAAAGLAGGFSVLITQPNSNPVQDNGGQIRALRQRAAALPLHLLPMGALSVGTQGKDMAELYDMQQSGAVAFTDGRKGTQNAGLLLRAMQYTQPFGGLIVQSPVDQSIAEGEMVAECISSVRMGMKGMPAMAEAMLLERDLRLLEHSPARMHIGPVTTVEGVALVRAAKERGLKFTAETSALYMLLDASENEGFDAATKVYPPLREVAAALALREAVLDGTIDIVTSSHHPQGREEKTHDFWDASFGADTLETAFAAIITSLREFIFPIENLINAISRTPRSILGLPNATIVEGGLAELTHFDPRLLWTPTVADIRSKCKYNPLLGRELTGRPLGVYVKGAYHPV